jgi:hypothetical protein
MVIDDCWYYLKATDDTTWRLPKCGIWACKLGVAAQTWERKSVKDKKSIIMEAPMTWEERKEEDRKMWKEIREKNRREALTKRENGEVEGEMRDEDMTMGGDTTLNYDDTGNYEDSRDYDSSRVYDDSRDYDDGRTYDNGRNHDESRSYENNNQNMPAAYTEDLSVDGDGGVKNSGDENMAG